MALYSQREFILLASTGIDHDDASSFYYDDHNVMVWGSHKWRDGVNKSYVSNLYVTPPDAGAAQQWGVGW